MISSGSPLRTSAAKAGSAQVAMLSALTATEMRSSLSGESALPVPSWRRSCWRSVCSSRTCMACLSNSLPAGVGRSGLPRTISTVPTCASSVCSRCETADWVIDSRLAAPFEATFFDEGSQAFSEQFGRERRHGGGFSQRKVISKTY